MYRKNEQHQQEYLFSSITELPKKQRERLEQSWAGTFYRDFFSRIDEDSFAVLYSETGSRPNIPVNVLVSLEALKAGFGWSDAELEEQMSYNMQVRYALGYRDVVNGHFELRTVYNFRRRLAAYMQETGENLLEKAFEEVTDKQIVDLKLKTGKLRMDSVQIASNIRQMSRVQLLVEVLQRVWRMLTEADQERYSQVFAAYIRGTSSQYTYHLEAGEGQSQLKAMGPVIQQLLSDLALGYGENMAYAVLERVYREHFVEIECEAQPKAGQELSAHSLQSPDDWEATYRQKRGVGYQGYVTNVTETCDPDNDLQLIVKVQTEANTTDDAAMLNAAVPNLVARTEVEALYTDGGYNSPDVDKTLNDQHVEQFQTAIRGAQAATDRLSVSDFVFTRNEAGLPQTVTCPQGQTVNVHSARQDKRFTAMFDLACCHDCPLKAYCPTQTLKKTKQQVLRFDQQQVNVAHRRANQRKAKASGRNLRSAVEATVRSIKHPFGQAKVPVRGRFRVSMTMIASAAMTNVRRIWRSQAAKTAKILRESMQKAVESTSNQPISARLFAFFRPLFRCTETFSQRHATAA